MVKPNHIQLDATEYQRLNVAFVNLMKLANFTPAEFEHHCRGTRFEAAAIELGFIPATKPE